MINLPAMERSAFIALLILLLTAIVLPKSLFADHSGGRAKNEFTLLGNLQQLVDISQDLDPETTAYIKPAENCFCSCRDDYWSCTDVECGQHNAQCENFLRREVKEKNTYRY